MPVAQLKKKINRRHLKYFSDLFQKTGFDISCKLFLKETLCLKCQTLFSEKKKKKKKKKNLQFEFSFGAQVRRYVYSRCGSYTVEPQ